MISKKVWSRLLLLVFLSVSILLIVIYFNHETYQAPPAGALGDYLLFNGSEVLSVHIGEDGFQIRPREGPGVWPTSWGTPTLCITTSQLFTTVGDSVGLVTTENGEYHFQKLANGINPSISPDGQKLAFYDKSGSITIFDLETKKSKAMNIVASLGSILVWISQTDLLFSDTELVLSVLNIDTGLLTGTGITNVLPFSITPDGSKVLCSTMFPSNVLIYDPQENDMIVAIENTSFGLVWSLDSRGFLFCRYRRLSNPFKDAPDLYYFSLSNETSYHLAKYFRLHNGIHLKGTK